jgi:alkaline phosphatase
MKTYLLFFLLPLSFVQSIAQPYALPHPQRLHAHNDYARELPFWNAWAAGCGSIEADLYWHQGRVYVAHDPSDLSLGYQLDSLYLDPIRSVLQRQQGRIYQNSNYQLHLLIDIKNARDTILDYLVQTAERYPDIFLNSSGVDLVLSGARPEPKDWPGLPDYILIDGRPGDRLSPQQMEKVAMVSASFNAVASWNGKGQLTPDRQQILEEIVARAHKQGKPFRFWGTPDTPSSWQLLIKNRVDIIGTDEVDKARQFVEAYAKNFYHNPLLQSSYKPQYPSFPEAPENIILLIGDGTGLSQLYAAYTANAGQLTLFNLKHTGWVHTRSADAYCTDSAAGASAYATGQKTDNRKIGVAPDHTPLPQLPKQLQEAGYRTGVITSVNIGDATPAAFYAQVPERDQIREIVSSMYQAPLHLLAGEGDALLELFGESFDTLRAKGSQLLTDRIRVDSDSNQVVIFPSDTFKADSSKASRQAFPNLLEDALTFLHQPDKPFFLVAESGRVDGGGHSNDMKMTVDEALSLDAAVARALHFIDAHPETLLIVLADHETGGLSLLDGNLEEGWVLGHFSTNDHTGVAIPCFAYGAGAEQFTGTLDNTAIHNRIVQLLERSSKP